MGEALTAKLAALDAGADLTETEKAAAKDEAR